MDVKEATETLSDNDRQLLAREVAADTYDKGWPMRTTMGNLSREGFVAGWDAAMEYVKREAGPHNEEEQGYPHFRNGEMPLG